MGLKCPSNALEMPFKCPSDSVLALSLFSSGSVSLQFLFGSCSVSILFLFGVSASAGRRKGEQKKREVRVIIGRDKRIKSAGRRFPLSFTCPYNHFVGFILTTHLYLSS